MAKINHPLFGSLGAFWVEGNDTPFYSLHDAKDHQQQHGGDLLHWDGSTLYPAPPPSVESTHPATTATTDRATMGIASTGNWFTRFFKRT